MSIKNDITQLKETLETDSTIRLLHFGIFPAASRQEIDRIEKEFFPLPAVMKELYAYTNGLIVLWEKKEDKPTEWPSSEALKDPDWEWTLNSYQFPRGLINILPLDKIFYHDWQDIIWFDGNRKVGQEELDTEAFKKAVKPFDLYSKYNSVCLFSSGEKIASCVLGDDHNADFESYQPLSMDKYLEKLFQTKGEQEARTKFFKTTSSKDNK